MQSLYLYSNPERTPDITLDIYLKQRPVLARLNAPSAPQSAYSSLSRQQEEYKWRPFHTQLPLLVVSALQESRLYRAQLLCEFENDRYLEDILHDARAEELTIPVAFLEKLMAEDGWLIADTETHRLLKNNPDIEALLAEYPLFWEVMRFAEGQPLYQVTLDVYDDVLKRGVPFALQFARYLCHAYHGIACDDAETNYGKPFQLIEDVRLAHRLSPSELEKVRWEWGAAK